MTVAKTVWGYIQNRDHRVMRRVNRWKAPRWIRYWMLAATRLGDGWIWYSAAILLLIFGGPQRFAAVSSAALAAVIGVLLADKPSRRAAASFSGSPCPPTCI